MTPPGIKWSRKKYIYDFLLSRLLKDSIYCMHKRSILHINQSKNWELHLTNEDRTKKLFFFIFIFMTLHHNLLSDVRNEHQRFDGALVDGKGLFLLCFCVLVGFLIVHGCHCGCHSSTYGFTIFPWSERTPQKVAMCSLDCSSRQSQETVKKESESKHRSKNRRHDDDVGGCGVHLMHI